MPNAARSGGFRKPKSKRRMDLCHSRMTNARAAPERPIRIAAVKPSRMPLGISSESKGGPYTRARLSFKSAKRRQQSFIK